MVTEALQRKLDQLPTEPGVYLFRDAAGELLYVGKAARLRSRVRSYFQSTSDGRLATFFIDKYVADVEFVITRSEKEALLLENNLIKKLKPRYNLRLRDDKTFLSLRLDPDTIPGAINFTLEEIEHRHHEIPRDRDIVLYCTCPNEVSSARTAFLLKKKGIHRVRPLEGGLDAWRERQYPVERRMNAGVGGSARDKGGSPEGVSGPDYS